MRFQIVTTPVALYPVHGVGVSEYQPVGAVRTKRQIVIMPPAVPVLRVVAGVLLGAAADAANAGLPWCEDQPDPAF